MRLNLTITWIFVLVTVLGMSAANAERIFACVGEDGKKIYSDNPAGCKNPEMVIKEELPTLIEAQELKTPSTSTSSSTTTAPKEDKTKYDSLAITSPSTQENIRSNIGDVAIAFQSVPALRSRNGHKYVVSLGSKEVYRGTQGSVLLKNVDRGTHIINAKIVTANGKTIMSAAPVEFTLHRYSSLQGNNIPPPVPAPAN